ncbi:hypothetical protein VL15_21880 [Burkholderia cepacia]|uniref:Uncharacterized protein n=1 Tax=Burkholderia cepacia TaxID=292 RepID=A0A0J5WGR5_BURCE|nr:hypothetical protein VL15_21880 [Burkholderia cepacia]
MGRYAGTPFSLALARGVEDRLLDHAFLRSTKQPEVLCVLLLDRREQLGTKCLHIRAGFLRVAQCLREAIERSRYVDVPHQAADIEARSRGDRAPVRLARSSLLQGLAELGFDSDEPINGGDAVDGVAALSTDVNERILVAPAAEARACRP